MDDPLLIIGEQRPTRSDAVQNRALLLETAQRLFRDEGVEAVSMTAIAQEAGVGKGTLYRHFENKAQLCQALLDKQQMELQNRTLERLRTLGDPLDNLRWFLMQVLDFVENNADMLRGTALFNDYSSLEHPAHLWWRQTILKLLQQLNPAGDAEYMADVLYLMIDIRAVLLQKEAFGYSSQRLRDGLIATLLRLIA